jgi:outer membrane protein OmpA-like peptidoglycan-associated protein
MKQTLTLFVLTLFLVPFIGFAQDKGGDKLKYQNQDQFFNSDKESKTYNYYERKKISQPLQPRYDTDSMPFQKGNKKKEAQQKAYLAKQYHYPAKPRDKWELGLNFGMALISGDVKPYWQRPDQNFGVGIEVRKSLGYIFSLRLGYNFQLMTGRNWERDNNLQFNRALNPSPNTNFSAFLDSVGPNYYDNPKLKADRTKLGYDLNRMWVYNYRTLVHQLSLEGVVNLGNLLFHRERTRWNIYALAGVSGFLFNTKYDALDKNGEVYDFSEIQDIWIKGKSSPYVNNDKNVRKSVFASLKRTLDGKYETQADNDANLPGIKFWTFIPAFTVGGGISFRPTNFMSIGIEERVTLTSNDVLDGYRWQQDEHNGMTRDYDNISYTSIKLGFFVGSKKRTEPLYWLNPMDYTYKKISDMDPEKIANDLNKDDDEDGVPNRLDKEPASKKDCPVDAKGVMLDSDKDGIVDCEDKEPFSPPGYPIDKFGVAQVPPPACCQEAGKGGGNGSGKGAYDCSKMELPSIYFDDDKYYLDPNNEGTLHTIAERLQMCPDVRLVVTGKDESKNDRKYNEQLAYNRSSGVIDYLVEKYGVSRDRFIVKYEGGTKAKNATQLEVKRSRKVEFKYAADGETGESNPPAPHPGLKAGSNK